MSKILQDIADPEVNMDAVRLEKAPKVAVYSPKANNPWDDAVTLVLTYAEIPYTVIYDEEILDDNLHLYDWLHLHHEDFTGQYGKFFAAYQNADWYRKQVADYESRATALGFSKVSQEKLAVAKKIRDFVMGGGYGILSRAHGLGLDNVVSFRIVLANGSVAMTSMPKARASAATRLPMCPMPTRPTVWPRSSWPITSSRG